MKQILFAGMASGSPDSPEWHAWRKAGIGGSEAPVIAAEKGLCSRASFMKGLHDLFLKKMGRRAPDADNFAMKRGKEGEEPARIAFETATGISVSPVFGEMDAFPFVHSSFDGITFDGETIIEIKCLGASGHALVGSGQVVDYYKPQLAHQGLTAWGEPGADGSNWAGKRFFFVSYLPEKADMKYVEVPATELAELANALLPLEIEFWDCIQNDRAPAGDEWAEAALQYLAAEADEKAAKAITAEAKARCIDLLKASKQQKIDAFGVMAYSSTRAGSIDYKSAFETVLSKLDDQTKIALDIDDAFLAAFKGSGSDTFVVRASARKEAEKPIAVGGQVEVTAQQRMESEKIAAEAIAAAEKAAREAEPEQAAYTW